MRNGILSQIRDLNDDPILIIKEWLIERDVKIPNGRANASRIPYFIIL